MISESAGFAGFAGFVSGQLAREGRDKSGVKNGPLRNPAKPANPALERCRICGGIVAPLREHTCDSTCDHYPDVHPACRVFGWQGVVYGPAEPPAGYTVKNLCTNCQEPTLHPSGYCDGCAGFRGAF